MEKYTQNIETIITKVFKGFLIILNEHISGFNNAFIVHEIYDQMDEFFRDNYDKCIVVNKG